MVIVNPRQVRDFARATGTLAKTDALDAAALAHFADAVRPKVRPLKDAETQLLSSLVAGSHQVISILVAERNRLGSAITVVRPRIEAHIAWLEQELSDIDEGLRKTLAAVQCAGRRMISCAAFPEWASNSPSLCYLNSRSWAR